MDHLRPYFVACLIAIAGCATPDAVLLSVSGDAKAEQYDLYVRDDASGQVIFHSGFNPVQALGEAQRDITRDKLKIALKLTRGGKFTLLLVGVIGDLDGAKPAVGSTQLFWAGRVQVQGTTSIDARLLTVPADDDHDRDLFPDAAPFMAHVPAAAMLYQDHADLLDCDDKVDNPTTADGVVIKKLASEINPFALEICNDGFDENCDGNADEACVDADGDHDFAGDDCDDNDPKRHHPTDIDPFPDPPNCCGYNLGKQGAEQFINFLCGGADCFAQSCQCDPLLCPMKRCGDAIDESCKGGLANDPANDTQCVVDEDCDTYPAPPQGNDCDDHNPNVHPNAPEICGNGIDDNCNGIIDDGCVPCDLDGDGYQRLDAASGCPDKSDKHPGLVDCNDYDAGVFPGQTSSQGNKEAGIGAVGMLISSLRGDCRHIYENTGVTGTARIASFMEAIGDYDCNGVAYEGCPTVACDVDGDGWPNATAGCNPTGLTLDCNDADPTIYPGAPDKCGNGKAENCLADSPCGTKDKDGDGYTADVDCDDGNPNVHPWAPEVCNGIDDDCDMLVDESNPDPTGKPLVTTGAVSTCTDSNLGECKKTRGKCVCSASIEMGQYAASAMRDSCAGEPEKPVDFVGHASRCFGAGQPKPQSCDSTMPRDDDCNGANDDPTGANLAVKGMPCGTNVGQCKQGIVVGCDSTKTNCFVAFGRRPASESWYVCSTAAPAPITVCPQTELCNGLDDDCDGTLAGTSAPPTPGSVTDDERDHDGDKYLACATCVAGQLATGLLGCNDCDDTNALVHPGAKDICNNIDDDCNPATPDGADECPFTTMPARPNCCSLQSACRNLATDTANCGTCGNVCDGLKSNACASTCQCGGAPACGSGQWCNGACTACNDKLHCGPGCVNCGAGVCKSDMTGCTGCNNDGDCPSTQYCGGGACMARQGPGGSCMADDQCLNGSMTGMAQTQFCTDGVCCNAPAASCSGCKLCNLAGMRGTCVVGVGTNPRGTACGATNHAICQAGVCNAAATCFDADSSPCGMPSCAAAALTTSSCMGGTCTAGLPMSCGGSFRCNGSGTACLMQCTVDGQCIGGFYCANPSCSPKKGLGVACGRPGECGSNNCVDGFCCSMSACGTCSDCSGAGGACTPVLSADDPDTCTGPNTCNASGVCKLKNGQGCGVDGTLCASTFCANGVCCGTACNTADTCATGTSVSTESCAAPTAGTCTPATIPCSAGYACTGTNPGRCNTMCTLASQCASGFFCNTPNCMPCQVATACGTGCSNCLTVTAGPLCNNAGGTYYCGCSTLTDCSPTGADNCGTLGGMTVCKCGSIAACPSGGGPGTTCNGASSKCM